MNSEIIVLIADKSESHTNILSFINFYSIKYSLATCREELISLIDSGIKCLVASFHAFSKYKDIELNLYDKLSYVLIYESESVEITADRNLDVSKSHRNICKELSGLSFLPVDNFISVIRKSTQYTDTLISTDNKPIFALRQAGNCQVFLLSTGVIDINKKLPGNFNITEHFISIAPIAMFIKYSFGHIINNSRIPNACLIIDDPLLQENYGFLNYHMLLSLMDTYNFFTSIAFIPWNYNRTDNSIAELFKSRPDRLSICVHGCDHTEGEFGITDLSHLDQKIKLATARMIEHEKITGIPFDKVMVFPQGVFSIEAMDALITNNYWAALNSVAIPVNGSGRLSIADYMQVGIREYADCPLFFRNTPESIVAHAVNLFLGKPIFIVIHNDYLKKGYDTLVESVKKINSLSENIIWASPGSIINKLIVKNAIDNPMVLPALDGLSVNGFEENYRIFMRRYASEFRDNYLSKNEYLSNFAVKLKNILNR